MISITIDVSKVDNIAETDELVTMEQQMVKTTPRK